MRKSIMKYLIIIILIIFVVLGYGVVQENNNLKVKLARNYQYLVSHTKFLLEQTNTEFWISTLQNENVETMFITFIADIDYTARELDRNGLQTVAEQMYILTDDYRKLNNSLKNNEDTITIEKDINKSMEFLTNQLIIITNQLGKDNIKWFNEIDNSSSKLHIILNEEFNKLHLDEKFEKGDSGQAP